MFTEYFKGVWRDRYILMSLVNKDLQLKYRRSTLGVAWSILMPLGLVLIIGSVYSIIFGTDPKTFIPLLFAGLNPWLFISSTADGGTSSFISAEGYLKQTTVNPQIFPIRTTLVNFINLLYSILAFFAVYLFLYPNLFNAKMLMVLPGLLLLFFFGLGWANYAAVAHLYIRDFQPLQSLILQGLFYATPIIFPASMLEEKGYEIVYRINPAYYLLEIVKIPMQGRALPSIDIYLIATLISMSVFIGSIYLVMKVKSAIVFKL